MTPYDAAMAGLIVAGMVWGACRGVTWQIASIASLVLGYTVSHPLSIPLAPSFPGDPVVARALAMLTVYLAVSGGIFLAAWAVRATLSRLKFEAFDRHLGMVLGGMEGALLGLVLTLFVVSLAPAARRPIFQSPTGKVVGQLMGALGPVLPGEARDVLAPFLSPTEALADRDKDTPEPAPAALTLPVPDRAAVVEGTRDGETTPASLSGLIEESETRIGRAIADGAAKGFQKAVGGANDGTVERR